MLDLAFAQRTEDNDVIDAVEELGAEMLTESVRNLSLDHCAVFTCVLEDVCAPDVRSHDDDGVTEVNGATL